MAVTPCEQLGSPELPHIEYSRLTLGPPRHGTCEQMPPVLCGGMAELTLPSRH